jgi:hypothetical protein
MKTLGLFILLSACDDGKVTIDASHIEGSGVDTGGAQGADTGPSDADGDGDGFSGSDDCDDTDAEIYPGAEEICNDLDDDCDGEVDNVPPTGDFDSLWFEDADADGFGAGEASYFACEGPPNFVRTDGDCADDDSEVHPGAEEICEDGKDNNCDGSSDPCVLEGIIPSDHAAQSVVGWQPFERIGTVAESAGDVNGDGLDDLLIAVPNSSEYRHEAGAIYMFTSPLDSTQTIEEADGIFLGSDIEEHAGDSITQVGDIDGDGNSDMAIGIPHESSMGRHSGAVSIVRGPATGAMDLQDAAYRFVGESAGFFTGSDVASVGDTDGDGIAEVAIGANGATLEGVSVGAVYLVQPAGEGTFNLLAEATAKVVGSHPGELNRMDLQPGGDFNGDGYEDLLVGAPHMQPSGMTEPTGGAYVVYGPLPENGSVTVGSAVFQGDTANGYAGFSVASLTDADGVPSIAIGCYNCSGPASTSGAVFLFQGATEGHYSLSDADVTITGEAYQDFAGYSIANAGDVNGDSVPDLLIGAKGNDFGTATTGAAYLLYGPTVVDTSLSLADLKVHGIDNNDQLGTHVAAAGDMDADGLAEIMVTAPLSDSSHEDVGRISIFYGNDRL